MWRRSGVGDLRARLAVSGGDVVIRRAEDAMRGAGAQAAVVEEFEGGLVAVVDQVTVNVEQGLAVGTFQDAVSPPDFFEEC